MDEMMEINFYKVNFRAIRESEYYQALKLHCLSFAIGIRTNVSTWDHCCNMFSCAGTELRPIGRVIEIVDSIVPSLPLNKILR